MTHCVHPQASRWVTYYGGLHLAKETLLSLWPLELWGCRGLQASRPARQPGEEEGKEEESREEVEEEAEEEELAGRKVRCFWPSGLYHGPLESRGEPYL